MMVMNYEDFEEEVCHYCNISKDDGSLRELYDKIIKQAREDSEHKIGTRMTDLGNEMASDKAKIAELEEENSELKNEVWLEQQFIDHIFEHCPEKARPIDRDTWVMCKICNKTVKEIKQQALKKKKEVED